MKSKRNICILALSLAASLLFWPCVGICSPTYTVTEEELTSLETHLFALEQNNNELTTLWAESSADLETARQALSASKMELIALKKQLQTLKDEAIAARQSLQTANAELAKAAQSLKQSEAAHGKTESRLRTQRNLWEVLFFVACGVAATR